MAELESLRESLYQASLVLSNLNLVHAAKWAAEALNGLAPAQHHVDYSPQPLQNEEKADQFSFLLARSYFNCKEFDRAAHALRNCTSGNALFLKLYSKFISIDKRATEDLEGFSKLGTSRRAEPGSGNGDETSDKGADSADGLPGRLAAIVSEIDAYHSRAERPNAFLLFLVGMIYNRRKRVHLARECLVNSLQLFPYNWSCWQDLLSSFSSYDEASAFVETAKSRGDTFASGVMFQIFEVVLLQEFYQQSSTFHEKIKHLSDIFPDFTFLKVQKFLVAYHGLDYYQAEMLFDEILIHDPMRIDDLDTYSNMLYVMEKKSKLAFLAQYTSQIDKFRSETCCVIANYHSMKGEHEKSVMYYKRALTLNKNCLSAWTLMGHEFVELKNSHAAIESYRRAVDINPKDFRAWYGLGQAYEVLDMHLYALYYYQRATNLQPTDRRMWQAIGNCYEKVDKLEDALSSFEKALAIETLNKPLDEGNSTLSVEPHICYKLAMISQKLGRVKETCKYMRICFDQELEWGVTDETSKARLWLARYALENKHFEEAYELAKEFNFSNAHDVEEARAIAKEARTRMSK